MSLNTLYLPLLVVAAILVWLNQSTGIEDHADHYKEHQDYFSLNKVVELIDDDVDTAYVKSLLGEPIDMGFDYRYLVDSVSPENCAVGAVFHIDEQGRVDDRWTGNICE